MGGTCRSSRPGELSPLSYTVKLHVVVSAVPAGTVDVDKIKARDRVLPVSRFFRTLRSANYDTGVIVFAWIMSLLTVPSTFTWKPF